MLEFTSPLGQQAQQDQQDEQEERHLQKEVQRREIRTRRKSASTAKQQHERTCSLVSGRAVT